MAPTKTGKDFTGVNCTKFISPRTRGRMHGTSHTPRTGVNSGGISKRTHLITSSAAKSYLSPGTRSNTAFLASPDSGNFETRKAARLLASQNSSNFEARKTIRNQVNSDSSSLEAKRTARTTPVRANRSNTVTSGSPAPRKISAPSKLVSAIGGSLDSLPETVTVRRKISTPVRPSISSPDRNFASNKFGENTGKKEASHTVSAANSSSPGYIKSTKRSSASTPVIKQHKKNLSVSNSTCDGNRSTRISKDHSASSQSFNHSVNISSIGDQRPKTSKKGFHGSGEIAAAPTLPVLKEERKKGRKKMSSSADNISDPVASNPSSQFYDDPHRDSQNFKGEGFSRYENTGPSLKCLDPCPNFSNKDSRTSYKDTLLSPPYERPVPIQVVRLSPSKISSSDSIRESLAPNIGSQDSAFDVPRSSGSDMHFKPSVDGKSHLEQMVSDLIKNSESKKQEIAALKMEINRLKEVVREKQSNNPSATANLSKDNPDSSALRNAPSPCPSENEMTRLEGVVDTLTTENRVLRDRLQQLGVSLDSSPLSDQQKELILSRLPSAFSQSGGNLSCSGGICERDWDKQSSSSMLSHLGIECLQGRIQQMEETHYSTNEELQATVEELEDLRQQLEESKIELQQFQEDKQVILESLTQQTEKLNEARAYNDTLKLMLIQQSENSQNVSQCEKSQRLMELLKNVQEDKELVQMKQDEIEQQMQISKQTEEHFHRESQLIRDRMKLLEMMVESANQDKRKVESQLYDSQEIIKNNEKETERINNLLQGAREKITELEAAVLSGEKSELADVLERVCAEKEESERELSNIQRRLNNTTLENDRLKDQLAALKENLRVTRNNAKTNIDDIEWHRTQLDERRRELELENSSLKAGISEAQMTCQHHLEDKRELKTSLSELQKKLQEASERQTEAERTLIQERENFDKMECEWEQFKRDLLTSVRVANDFKTEAHKNLEQIQQENILLKEKIRQLEFEMDKNRAILPSAATSKYPSPSNSLSSIGSLASNPESRFMNSTTPGERRLYKAGDPIFTDRRANPRPLSRGDSRVKSLIETIENVTMQAKNGSRSSSTSSIASVGSENNNSNKNIRRPDNESIIIRSLPASLTPLKDTISSPSPSPSPLRTLSCNTFPEPISTAGYGSKQSHGGSTNLPDTVKISQISTEKISSSKYSTNSSSIVGFSSSSSQSLGNFSTNNTTCLVNFPTSSNSIGNININETSTNKHLYIPANKIESIRRPNFNSVTLGEKKDPLAQLAQSGGSKRNALLKWCQNKTLGYKGVDITNFSSSWNDGLAFCALIASYLPEKIDYDSLNLNDKKRNFELAFSVAESVGVSTPSELDINDMLTLERPSWQIIYKYITNIFSHFET